MLATPSATFRLPDVLVGTSALMGAFPRLVRNFGLQRANLIALTAYTLHANEAQSWGLVQKVVHTDNLIPEAVKMASLIAGMSPDSVVVSRLGVREAWETASVEGATKKTIDEWGDILMSGENMKEGLKAFREKRKPRWVPSKL